MQSGRPELVSAADVVAYRSAVSERASDFAFLVGEWAVDVTRFADDGSEAMQTTGRWSAAWQFAGRLLLDRFVSYAPDGEEMGAAATLRTWCEETGRWEMTFLYAARPDRVASFVGERVGDEMHLVAHGRDQKERRVEVRVRFHEIGPEAFSWEQRSRLAEGGDWFLDARMRARRIA